MAGIIGGAASGAAVGATLGGPVGAVVGGFAGGVGGFLNRRQRKREQKELARAQEETNRRRAELGEQALEDIEPGAELLGQFREEALAPATLGRRFAAGKGPILAAEQREKRAILRDPSTGRRESMRGGATSRAGGRLANLGFQVEEARLGDIRTAGQDALTLGSIRDKIRQGAFTDTLPEIQERGFLSEEFGDFAQNAPEIGRDIRTARRGKRRGRVGASAGVVR